MVKEKYLTNRNYNDKISSWKKKLSKYNNRWKKFNLENSALVVIDMQNYFLEEKSHAFVPTSETILKNIKNLILSYRKNKLPVIFTYFSVKKNEPDQILKWWGDTVIDQSWQSEIVEELKPEKKELIIRKTTYNSFHNTKLEKYLIKNKVTDVVITGVLTNLCCETTAREAFIRNFNVFFAIDSTASYNEEMHLASLVNLSYGFATPIITKEISFQKK